jgi:hypothetical protein
LTDLTIMSSLARYRLFVVNAFIATIVILVLLDTLPQASNALRTKINPLLVRLGINQGQWNLFAPVPDRVNTRLRAEITYQDGEKREWNGPDWGQVSAWEKWIKHRHVEWLDHIAPNQAAWESWCRFLALSERPDYPNADRGAEVRVIFHEAVNPPSSDRPWPSIRQPAKYDDGWVMTIEKLE